MTRHRVLNPKTARMVLKKPKPANRRPANLARALPDRWLSSEPRGRCWRNDVRRGSRCERALTESAQLEYAGNVERGLGEGRGRGTDLESSSNLPIFLWFAASRFSKPRSPSAHFIYDSTTMTTVDPPTCDQLANRTNLRSLGNETHPIHCYMLTQAAAQGAEACESYYFSDFTLFRRGFQLCRLDESVSPPRCYRSGAYIDCPNAPPTIPSPPIPPPSPPSPPPSSPPPPPPLPQPPGRSASAVAVATATIRAAPPGYLFPPFPPPAPPLLPPPSPPPSYRCRRPLPSRAAAVSRAASASTAASIARTS